MAGSALAANSRQLHLEGNNVENHAFLAPIFDIPTLNGLSQPVPYAR